MSPDYSALKEQARDKGVHASVTICTAARQKGFLRAESAVAGGRFVTARGAGTIQMLKKEFPAIRKTPEGNAISLTGLLAKFLFQLIKSFEHRK